MTISTVTFSITTFSIMTLGIKILFVTLSITLCLMMGVAFY